MVEFDNGEILFEVGVDGCVEVDKIDEGNIEIVYIGVANLEEGDFHVSINRSVLISSIFKV